MPEPIPVTIPLINPNEPEALLAALQVRPGDPVTTGQVICTLETTKATHELVSEVDGYIAGLRFAAGQTVRAGDLLCYLAESPDWTPPEQAARTGADPAAGDPFAGDPPGLRITRPARALAEAHGLDLAALPSGPLVTEEVVKGLIAGAPLEADQARVSAFDPTALLVYGGGGHAKSLIDLVRALGVYRLVGVVDDRLPAGETVLGLPILGGAEVLEALHSQGVRLAVNAVGGIGDITVRITVFGRLADAGYACPSVVHPTALVEPGATLSAGVQVFPHAYIGSDAQVGFGAIVNTGAIVSHDCTLGDYANLSPGAILAGGVTVGSGALLGMGVTVNLGVTIGAGARVGNGATVKSDVPARGVVRAGATWPEP